MSTYLSSRLRRLKKAFGIHSRHSYGSFSIQLPADHLLPVYQRDHRLYDRFLPHLAKYLEPGAVIVDVGANCGDSAAAMYLANPKARYVCIEPDNAFFGFLSRNIDEIRKMDSDAAFDLHQSLVGKDVTGVALVGSDGSKHAVISDDGQAGIQTLSARTLDRLLVDGGIQDVRLLKSDVDGFDYDVVNSAEETIRCNRPLIFFECQTDTVEQKAGYQKTMAELQNVGYDYWVVFDNFGEVVLNTRETGPIFQLLEYVWRQNSKRSTRTIYYFDILAVTREDEDLIEGIVGDYVRIG